MSNLTPAERVLAGRIGGHLSWANTEDRAARTRNGRAAFEQKFLDEAGGDPVRAQHLRKAYYHRLALVSAQARRRKPPDPVEAAKASAEAAKAVEAELAALRGGAA